MLRLKWPTWNNTPTTTGFLNFYLKKKQRGLLDISVYKVLLWISLRLNLTLVTRMHEYE